MHHMPELVDNKKDLDPDSNTVLLLLLLALVVHKEDQVL
jgi:hypothetical protein